MIAYLDSAVLLRIVLREPNPLREWHRITDGVTSTLTRVEVARTFARNAVLGTTSEAALIEKRAEMDDLLRRVDFVQLDEQVLEEAAQPLPVVLGTLDAIHLASAILFRATQPPGERSIVFATHDQQLARAARALHFEVLGA